MQRAAGFGMLLKTDGSPATEGDRRAEKKIVEILSTAFPSHRLMGEEYGVFNPEASDEFTWAFDPIDGTWSFLNQETTACVNLVLLHQGKPLVGVVFNPWTQELYEGAQGQPTRLDGRELPLTRWPHLKDGTLNYHLARNCRPQIDAILRAWEAGEIGKLISAGGSPTYSFAQTAKGAHTAFVVGHKSVPPDAWDLSTGVLLVRGAGGRVTDLNGHDIDPLTHQDFMVASTHPDVHNELLEVLRREGFANSKE